jgi:NAD-dependent dihydropyrimidine dehydrogenase PreA subunit
MSALSERVRDVLQSAFRLAPWPTEAGLRAVGSPDASSPVLITGNYDLTVRRVIRALDGIDAWLVVAPSQGINVWCAASGGHLSTHQVVTALKTSGVGERVKHRSAILPQLAATGVRAVEVSRRCGWKLRFGPVRAEDIPEYLARGARKTEAMRRVRFDLVDRSEMAWMWAAPTAAVLAGAAALLHAPWILPGVGLTLALSFAVFLTYDRLPEPRRPIFGAAAVALGLAAVAAAGGGGAAWVAMPVATVLLTALLTYDHPGSTPIEGGAHFAEHSWRIALDPERCRGVYACWEVCPEACFEKREEERKVVLAHDDRCIRCGACVVQCPTDALAFEDAAGVRIEPDLVRRFKLNLLGRRVVDAGEGKEG